jgi:DNA-binding NarL/FixJ family response regulator
MNSHDCRHGLILSSRIIAAHQTATLLERQGWQMSIEYDEATARQLIDTMQPALLVIDIDCPGLPGARLLAGFRHAHPGMRIVAICNGGNSQGMRMARALGIDGYFYLQPHGVAVDSLRGMARQSVPVRQVPHPLSGAPVRAGHRVSV